MEIFTLGTGSCEVNKNRFNSSVLVKTEGKLYLFDAGQPVDALIVRSGNNILDLKAVFISHMHADHVSGLPSLIRSISTCNKCGNKVSVVLPDEFAVDSLCSWMDTMHILIWSKYVTFSHACPGFVFSDNHITLRAIPTDHMRSTPSTSFAYTLDDGQKRILYTGDLSTDLHDFPACVFNEYFDACIMEATHYQPATAIQILEHALLGQLILVHVHSPDCGVIPPTLCNCSELVKALHALPYPVYLSYDGSIYNI